MHARTPAHLHTCTHACMYTRTHAHMLTCTHAHMHACTYTHMDTCSHAHMHTCTHVHTHTCIHAHMHACTHVHMHTMSCIHAHMPTCTQPEVLTAGIIPSIPFTFGCALIQFHHSYSILHSIEYLWFQTAGAGGDPHFLVNLPDNSNLCFSLQGEPRLAFNLVTSKFIAINAVLIDVPTGLQDCKTGPLSLERSV